MDLALLALVGTLAIVGAVVLLFMALVKWRRWQGRPPEIGTMGEGWRRDHIAGKAGGDR